MHPESDITERSARLKPHKMLLFAIAASLAVHLLMLSGLPLTLPDLSPDRQLLEARLVELKPPPQPAQPDIVKKAAPRKPAPADKPAPQPAAAPPQAEAARAETPAAAEPAATAVSAPPPEPPDSSSETSTAEEARHPAYTHAETEFEVFRGSGGAAAGKTRIVYNADNNGRYSISSITEAKGLVSLFFGTLVQKSEGSITASGLKPGTFTYQYGNDAKKLQRADFAWEESVLHLHTAKGDSTVNLPAGTQDFLSFMYQFMFSPPLENMQITMTNGKKLRTYFYSFEGEEVIHTKAGDLNTVHILKKGDDEEKTELWLAVDYLYLPARIRKTEKDGSVIEQVASSIQARAAN